MAQQSDIPAPYGYMLFPLTKEETMQGGKCFGFNYAWQNKDRWVSIDDAAYELQTYDRGFTHIFYDNKVYNLFCDYVMIEDKTRLYIGKFYDTDTNVIKPLEENKYQKKDINGNNVTIKVNGSLRDLETARIQREKCEKEKSDE